MRNHHGLFVVAAALALGVTLTPAPVFAQSQPPTQGPAVGDTPAWFLQGSFPDPGGRTVVEPGGKVTIPGRAAGPGGAGGRAGGVGGRGRGAAAPAPGAASPGAVPGGTPGCNRSPLCGRRGGIGRQTLQRVEWSQMPGY